MDGPPAATPNRRIEIGRVLGIVARGACMGAADVVPGVSGGTVALLTGIYDRLIEAAHAGSRTLGCVVRGNLSGALAQIRGFPWSFTVPLLAGLLASVGLLAGVINDSLIDHPEPMAGLFLGLVVASVLVARQDVSWNPFRLAVALIVGTVLFVALGWQGEPLHHPSPAILFVSGAAAVCAMVLPGISGSFLLLMMGMYASVIEIVDERLLADAAVLAAGAIVGLACFSSLLARLLERRPDTVMAIMVGLLLGSLRVLWPWPHGVGIVSHHNEEAVSGTQLGWPETSRDLLAPSLLAVIAVVVVLCIARLSRSRRDSEAPVETI